MLFFLLLLILGFLIFLFCLYVLSKDDTVLLRKNVSAEQVFDVAFILFGAGFFAARFWYVVFHFSPFYLNPLVFFSIVRYPGLSVAGGLLTCTVTALFLFRKKRMPLGRMFDSFGVSLLAAMPLGALATVFLKEFTYFDHVFLPLLFICLFFIAYVFFLPKTLRNEIRSGSLGVGSLMTVSFVLLLLRVLSRENIFKTSDIILLIVLFLSSIIFFLKQEFFFTKLQ